MAEKEPPQPQLVIHTLDENQLKEMLGKLRKDSSRVEEAATKLFELKPKKGHDQDQDDVDEAVENLELAIGRLETKIGRIKDAMQREGGPPVPF